jgi:hypothetical protein
MDSRTKSIVSCAFGKTTTSIAFRHVIHAEYTREEGCAWIKFIFGPAHTQTYSGKERQTFVLDMINAWETYCTQGSL